MIRWRTLQPVRKETTFLLILALLSLLPTAATARYEMLYQGMMAIGINSLLGRQAVGQNQVYPSIAVTRNPHGGGYGGVQVYLLKNDRQGGSPLDQIQVLCGAHPPAPWSETIADFSDGIKADCHFSLPWDRAASLTPAQDGSLTPNDLIWNRVYLHSFPTEGLLILCDDPIPAQIAGSGAALSDWIKDQCQIVPSWYQG